MLCDRRREVRIPKQTSSIYRYQTLGLCGLRVLFVEVEMMWCVLAQSSHQRYYTRINPRQNPGSVLLKVSRRSEG